MAAAVFAAAPIVGQAAPVARTAVSRISLGSVDAEDSDKNRLEIVTIPGETTNTFGQYIRRLAQEDAPGCMPVLAPLPGKARDVAPGHVERIALRIEQPARDGGVKAHGCIGWNIRLGQRAQHQPCCR